MTAPTLVSWNSISGVFSGLLPFVKNSTTAPMPAEAILRRCFMAVASTSPCSTLRTPSQPQPRAAWPVH
ncbi:MAG: hypothetical protein F4205_09840 [Gemmatimonadetes bacterium]|nr:hypothetical protein [Gemmatimonadota bacterium]MXX72006.1 hypothetical protein [Gemmatimonadota bacterium]MYC91601.1 hypothetical protein [Gemmatimonadota bacterium]MYG35784.1 hypothetical protein [Gemmatimonadota bacterium]